jgi:hypothetical protein
LLPIDRINEHKGARLPGSSVLCGGWKVRDVLPSVESLPHFLAVLRSREEVASRTEVLRDWAIGGEEPLGVSG